VADSQAVRAVVKKILSVKKAVDCCDNLPDNPNWQQVAAVTRSRLGLSPTISGLENIPESGRLVVMSNHAYTILDAISLAAAVERVRGGVVKVVVDKEVDLMPEISHLTVPANNMRGRLRSVVEKDGALIVFPSGRTSHLDYNTNKVIEPEWNPKALDLAMRIKAQVLPAAVKVNPPKLFNLIRNYEPEDSDLSRIFALRVATQPPNKFPITFGEVKDFEAVEDVKRIVYDMLKDTA